MSSARESHAPPQSESVALRDEPISFFVAELDFEKKEERVITCAEAQASMEAGRFVWIDATYSDVEVARKRLIDLGLVEEELIDDALSAAPTTQQGRYPKYLHLAVTGCKIDKHTFELERVDIFIGERFMLSIHRGRPQFIAAVRREYRDDFQRFARSPSFLLYEIWDHLLENYVRVQKRLEERVEQLQQELIGDVDDRVFAQVSEIGADLLNLRKVLLPARAVLTDISTRKSLFVSEATQPFLANMVGTVERVLQDLMADRDILSDSLNLYMSLVGHRTNRVMNRLTVVSVIFLPLSFLCGVYGMNFVQLPELQWENGYLYFWSLVGFIVLALVFALRRMRVL
jgi:magnesium transporter